MEAEEPSRDWPYVAGDDNDLLNDDGGGGGGGGALGLPLVVGRRVRALFTTLPLVSLLKISAVALENVNSLRFELKVARKPKITASSGDQLDESEPQGAATNPTECNKGALKPTYNCT